MNSNCSFIDFMRQKFKLYSVNIHSVEKNCHAMRCHVMSCHAAQNDGQRQLDSIPVIDD